jgi:CelD/BcsL family acetyltransferase involved in cellulose biosynthesis
MQITVVRPHELGESEIDLWREFQGATRSLGHPMLAPEFAVVVGRHRPQARVAVLSEGAQIVGFFPFEAGRLGHGGPIAVNLTGCQGLVHAPGADWDPDELMRACGLSIWEFDCLVEGQEPFDRYVTIRVPSPIMDLGQGWDRYSADLRKRSPNNYKKILQKSRKLGRDVGDLTFAPDVPTGTALRTLMRWKSDQYRLTGRSDRFAWRGVPEILDELLTVRSPTFAALLSTLHAGDHLVGATFTLTSHRTAAGWFAGYNPEFAKYSVGTRTQLFIAEMLAADGIRELHMGRGTRDVYKQVLKSRDLVVGEGRVTRRTPLGALHWARSAPTRRVRYFVTETPQLLRAADRTLYRYGRLRTSLSRRIGREGALAVPGAGAR